MPTTSTRLRGLISREGGITVVEPLNSLTARLVQHAGFEATYIGGHALGRFITAFLIMD